MKMKTNIGRITEEAVTVERFSGFRRPCRNEVCEGFSPVAPFGEPWEVHRLWAECPAVRFEQTADADHTIFRFADPEVPVIKTQKEDLRRKAQS